MRNLFLSQLGLLLYSVVTNAQQLSSLYTVKTCLVDAIGDTSCTPQPVSSPIRYQTQPVVRPGRCEDTVGQRGSLSFVDLILPPNQVLWVEVTTNANNQGGGDFFVRPSRLTDPWGTPLVSGRTASFYIAGTGQFSVEFAPSSIWR